ncbi:MAG: hypothetical protein ACHP79_07105 [Terriglobales bacterium]
MARNKKSRAMIAAWNEEGRMGNLRWGKATIAAVLAFFITFIIVWIPGGILIVTIDPRETMAGLATFIFGIPAGFLVGAITFLVVLFRSRKREPQPSESIPTTNAPRS